MNHFNTNDKYIASVVVWLASIEGFIITIASILSINTSTDSKITILAITFIVSFFILLFFKQQIIHTLIRMIKFSGKKKNINTGEWLLDISFDDETPNIRGNCTIKHTLSGVKIFGGKLLNQKNEIIRKEKWISENVEFLDQDNNDVLIYLYKTPVDEHQTDKDYENMVFDKVGLVVAKKIKGSQNVYEGIFRDFPLREDQNNREGKVILTPISDK